MKNYSFLLLLFICYQLQAQTFQTQNIAISNITRNHAPVAMDSGNVYHSGNTITNISNKWSTTAQEDRSIVNKTALDSNLNVNLNGLFYGSVNFIPDSNLYRFTSNDGLDVFVFRLDSNGNLLSAINLSGTNGLFNFLMGLDSNLTIRMGGTLYKLIDLDLDSNSFAYNNGLIKDLFQLNLDSNNLIFNLTNSLNAENLNTINRGRFNLSSYFNSLINANNNTLKSQSHSLVLLQSNFSHKIDSGSFQTTHNLTNLSGSKDISARDIFYTLLNTRIDSGAALPKDSGAVISFEEIHQQVNNHQFFGAIKNDPLNQNLSTNLQEGINESANTLRFYPNPTKDRVNIQTEEKILTINILNISGALVKTTTQSTFSVNELSNGVYYLQVQTENGLITEKLIKE